MAEVKRHGGCICGAVKYTTRGRPARITVCHCRWCQQRTGTSFGTEVVFPKENVEITGEVRRYRHISDESGRWLDVHFCPQCGTNLGLTLELRPEIRSIPAGTFAGDSAWLDQASEDIRHVYTRSKQHWSDLLVSTESFEAYFE